MTKTYSGSIINVGIPVQFKPTTIFLRKNRHECKSCGKVFYPQNDFIAKYKRKSKRLVYFIVALDGETHKIVDILECRHKHFLCEFIY